MPRVRERKTTRGMTDLAAYKQAYDEVKAGSTLRAAAKKNSMNHCSLLRYIRKRDAAGGGDKEEESEIGYKAHNRVFNLQQERELCDYLIRCADIYFGLSKKDVRKLAFELTIKFDISRPKTWDKNKMAGEEWFRMFMKRNPELLLRAEQAASLSRVTSFNRDNVDTFYNNLATVMDRYKFEAHTIFNVGETGVTTVNQPDRIVTKRSARQVGAVASTGNLVTVSFAVNAIGDSIPPFFVFPRLKYCDNFIWDGPIGSAGSANPSGWMQNESFINFLQHFKKHSNASLDNNILLLLDNHSSHVHINALDFCKTNGIVMLSFPPLCSHRLQPLDSVFGPLKKAVNSTCDGWIRSHPNKTMTIYDVPRIIADAMPLALTSQNIQAGFRTTGIVPFNRHLFTELDFNTIEAAHVSSQNINSLEDRTPPSSPSILNFDSLESESQCSQVLDKEQENITNDQIQLLSNPQIILS